MPKNSNEPDASKLVRANVRAALRLVRLIIFKRGPLMLTVATLLSLLLWQILALNPLLSLLGSLLGVMIVSLMFSPLNQLWSTGLANAYREEGLINLADKLARNGISDEIKDILAGRIPQSKPLDLRLKISQLQILTVERGDMKTALKFAEFLHRDSANTKKLQADDACLLGIICNDLGDFEKGIRLLRSSVEELQHANRQDAHAYVESLFGLLQASLDLERIADAENYLQRVKEAIHLCYSSPGNNTSDGWAKKVASNKGVDHALYLFYSARLLMLKSDKQAESRLLEALEEVRALRVGQSLKLLYPEVLYFQTLLMLQNSEFIQAEKLASQANVYLESKTENRGIDYWKAKQILAYSLFKNGKAVADELADCMNRLKEQVYLPHPYIASGMLWLSEACAEEGDIDKSMKFARKALKMRKALLPKGSSAIREAETLIQGLSAQARERAQS